MVDHDFASQNFDIHGSVHLPSDGHYLFISVLSVGIQRKDRVSLLTETEKTYHDFLLYLDSNSTATRLTLNFMIYERLQADCDH